MKTTNFHNHLYVQRHKLQNRITSVDRGYFEKMSWNLGGWHKSFTTAFKNILNEIELLNKRKYEMF